MKNKLVWHEIVLFSVVLVLLLWKLIMGRVTLDISLLWWLLGICIGFLFIFFDRFIYSFYTHKDEELSMKVSNLFKEKRLGEALSFLLNERQEQRELVMRSYIFVLIWIVMSIFAITSSLNFFARGLLLGIGIHLMFDMTTDFLWSKERFDLWFWQIKRKIGDEEKKWFFGLTVLLFILISSSL